VYLQRTIPQKEEISQLLAQFPLTSFILSCLTTRGSAAAVSGKTRFNNQSDGWQKRAAHTRAAGGRLQPLVRPLTLVKDAPDFKR